MDYKTDHRLITTHYAEHYEDYYNAIVPPIFMNSLNLFDTIEDYYAADKEAERTFVYGRVQNPTVRILEQKIAALEHGKRAFAFASGMAAATAAVLSVCPVGGNIVCLHSAYGPLVALLKTNLKNDLKMNTTFVTGTDMEEWEAVVTDQTDLIILESPSSIIFSLQDIAAVTELAKRHQAKVYIDNTYATPLHQNPLDLGADLVMHTMSKYMGGHSDIIGGVLVAKQDDLIERLSRHRELFGAIIGPMEAWLVMRGLRSMAVRLKEHERIATQVAEFLENHSQVAKVYYPGLKSHPQAELYRRQQTGSCGLLSLELVGTEYQSCQFINQLQLFKIGVSWGGFESLAFMPFLHTKPEILAPLQASNRLIRLHCGLEGSEALLQDIEQALNKTFG